MAQSNMTEGTTYILIGFVVLLFIFMISSMGTIISNSPYSELTNNSEQKMLSLSLSPKDLGFTNTGTNKTELYGFNVSIANDNVESAITKEGTDNKNEFSLDFTFGKKKANGISRFIYAVVKFPEFLVSGLFGLSMEGLLGQVISLINWLWNILIFVAIVYFVRNK